MDFRSNDSPHSIWPRPRLLLQSRILLVWCILLYLSHLEALTGPELTKPSLASCVQPMHVLSVLCSPGLEIPGSPSELSGQHFFSKMLSWPHNDRSSLPLAWLIWSRCSFLRVPGALSAYLFQSTLETLRRFCLLICHANQTIIFLRSGGTLYLSLHSQWLEKYLTFRRSSINVFGKKVNKLMNKWGKTMFWSLWKHSCLHYTGKIQEDSSGSPSPLLAEKQAQCLASSDLVFNE